MSLSLDTAQLGLLYLPYETGAAYGMDGTGWNMEVNSQTSAYFASQGSEYVISQPTTTVVSTLSTELIQTIQSNVQAFYGTAATLPGAPVAQLQRILDWANGLTTSTPVDGLQVSSNLIHKRSLGDDNGSLQVLYLFCPPLECPIPVQVTVSIDWAGTLTGFNQTVSMLQDVVKFDKLLAGLIEEFLIGVGLGSAFTFFSVATLALVLTGLALKFILSQDADGGEVNFVAVICHAIHNFSSCMGPRTYAAPDAKALPALSPGTVGTGWITTSRSQSLGMNQYVSYGTLVSGTYPPQRSDGPPYDTTARYLLGMPDLTWSPSGGLLLTTLVNTFGTDYCALVIMVFNSQGGLMQETVLLQSGHMGSGIAVPDPVSYDASYLDYWVGGDGFSYCNLMDVIKAEYKPWYDAWNEKTSTLGAIPDSALQMVYSVPEIMSALCQNIQVVSGSWNTMAPPVPGASIRWNLATSSYDSGNHAVVRYSGGQVVQIHEGGTTNLYTRVTSSLDSGDLTVSWNGSTHHFDSGDFPTFAINSQNQLLLIHVDSGGNTLYWSVGTVNSGSVDIDGAPHNNDYTSGMQPTILLRDGYDNLVLVLHLNTNVNSSMVYDVGLYDSGTQTVSWTTTNQMYIDGNYPSIVCTPNNAVIELHEHASQIWYAVGTIADHNSLVQWGDAICMNVDGSHPSVAMWGNTVVATYDNNGTCYYCVGTWDSDTNTVQWITLNNSYASGDYPRLCFTNANTVLCVRHTSGGDDCYSDMGAVNLS